MLAKSTEFTYEVPKGIEHKSYVEFIEGLPSVDNPELFGLNSNSDIAFRTKETKEMIDTIMITRPKEAAGDAGMTREELISNKAANYLAQITYHYDTQEVDKLISKLPGPKTFPKDEIGFSVPLNTFLSQEV